MDTLGYDPLDDDAPSACTCGSTETVEVTFDGPPEQTVRVCAECGSDEP